MLSVIRGLGLLLSGLVFAAGAVFYSIFPPTLTRPSPSGSPTSTATATASSPTAPQSPGNPSEGIRPTEAPSGFQQPPRATTEPFPLPTVSLPGVPTVIPQPTFLPLPTVPPTLPPPLGRGCYQVEITPNTPSGIAGCIQFGRGTASYYTDTGLGAAMNFCTWIVRTLQGCGTVKVTALSTGRSIVIPVVDFCDCFWLTDRRIIDLQGGAVDALGLNRSRGLWKVEVSRQ